MSFRTCLLITDDPDHLLEFSEALEEVSPDTILLTIARSNKAMDFLQGRALVPEFLFLDEATDATSPEEFVATLSKIESLAGSSIIILAERGRKKLDGHPSLSYFSKDYSYVELREFLTKLINP
jgi:hypothetical protein